MISLIPSSGGYCHTRAWVARPVGAGGGRDSLEIPPHEGVPVAECLRQDAKHALLKRDDNARTALNDLCGARAAKTPKLFERKPSGFRRVLSGQIEERTQRLPVLGCPFGAKPGFRKFKPDAVAVRLVGKAVEAATCPDRLGCGSGETPGSFLPGLGPTRPPPWRRSTPRAPMRRGIGT